MKFLKKTLKTLLCASLVLSLGISATACSTDDNPSTTEPPTTDDGPEYVEPPFTPPDDGSEGIDWSKYWDGTVTGSSADNFKFTGSKDIGTLTGDYTPTITPAQEGEPVIVTFSDGVAPQSIDYGGLAVKPNTPDVSGKMLVDWYSDSGLNTVYDFNAPVTSTNLSLHAKWADLPSNIESVKGNQESITVIFQGGADTTVKYKKVDDGEWQTVDAELVRSIGNNESRVDILGLAKNTKYNVKIGDTDVPAPVTVDAYDRSGYAHFNYTEGVGAYKDDGTLKDNALVIYVTDKNKNTVMNDVCAANSDVPMFQIPGSDWDNKNASGIGWWLNNNQYTTNNLNSDKNKVPSNTYDQANGGKLAFKAVDRPIVIRFIGTVTTPEGCTAYNSEKEGGSVGDNGNMARMKNYKNVTLEGVGDDAIIQGWGFHYVIGTDAKNGQGTSFEVRNLTFNEYTEDAVGMEGQQSGGKITAAVSRCWIHNNTFLPGRCDNPAESDKKEGDGSCDFKRGEYYTCSYNYFEYCHKTNLIGSSDSSLQYNISMHHNMWYQCGSRIPLLRQANVHFYNNYVCGDATEKTTPYSHISKPALSYVHSLRANCYMFSEANYYEGSKNITDGKNGGSAKSWNDIVTQSFGTDTMVYVQDREQTVSNNCAYNGTSYSSFDTDSSLFYYDSENKKTDALVDGAVAARTRVLYEVGALGFEPRVAQQKTTTAPQTDLSNIQLPKDGKGRGEIVVFKLVGNQTQVTITTNPETTGDPAPDLYDSYGRVWLANFTGTKTIVLPAGTYVLASGQKDKDCKISSITIVEDSAAASEARIEAAKQALSAIPNTITIGSEYVINEAKTAYSALLGDEVNEISSELIQRYEKAAAAYEDLLIDYVIARINHIGEVTADSYVKINAADKAYKQLSADKQAKVTNKSTLDAAWVAFANYEVQNVVNRLNDLPDLTAADVNIKSSATVEKLYDWFNAVQDAYDDLKDDDGEDKRAQVPADSYKKLTDGLAELQSVEGFLTFKETLEDAALEDASKVGGNLVSLYNKLTEAQQGKLTAEEKAKYAEIKAAYEEYASQAVVAIFTKDDTSLASNVGFTVNGKKGYKGSSQTFTYDGKEYDSPLKLQSGDTVTFSTAVAMKVVIKLHSGGSQKILLDGTSYNADSDGIVTINSVAAGNHTIGRDGEGWLCYVELAPAV